MRLAEDGSISEKKKGERQVLLEKIRLFVKEGVNLLSNMNDFFCKQWASSTHTAANFSVVGRGIGLRLDDTKADPNI